VPFPPVAAEKWAPRRMESMMPIGSAGAASNFVPLRLQHPIAGHLWQKYTLDISRLFNVLKLRLMSP
jgi:hypothetical protein